MTTHEWVMRVTAVVGAAVMSGCYTYVPVERPTPGSTVRIEVPIRTPVSSARGGGSAGGAGDEAASMEGTLVSAGDSIVLAISTLKTIGNFRQIKSLDTLRVARADVRTVSTRTFSRPRTIVLTAVIAAATTVLAVAVIGLGGGDAGGGRPPGGTTTGQIRVIPVFSAILRVISR